MREAGRSARLQVQVSSNVWNPALADERWEKRYTARKNGIVLGRRGMELGIIRDSTQLGTHYSNDPTYTPWGIIKTWHYVPPWHYIPLSLDNYYLLFISLPLFISTYISPSLPPISCELLSPSFFPPRPRGSYVIFFVPPHSYFLWGSFLSLSPISFSLSPFLSIYLSLSLSPLRYLYLYFSGTSIYNNGLFFLSFFPMYILHFHYVPHFHHHSFPLCTVLHHFHYVHHFTFSFISTLTYIYFHHPSFPLSTSTSERSTSQMLGATLLNVFNYVFEEIGRVSERKRVRHFWVRLQPVRCHLCTSICLSIPYLTIFCLSLSLSISLPYG